jgi:hypothetical protein
MPDTPTKPWTLAASDVRDMAALVPTDNPPKRTLADLRVGDEVVRRYGHTYDLCVVERVTPTMICLSLGRRFYKKTGYGVAHFRGFLSLDENDFEKARIAAGPKSPAPFSSRRGCRERN